MNFHFTESLLNLASKFLISEMMKKKELNSENEFDIKEKREKEEEKHNKRLPLT